MVRKFAKARAIKGFRFIRVLSPCPPGWKTDPMDTTKLSRLAVQTGMFRLYEVENGAFKLNMPVAKRKPVEEYLKAQGRFKSMTALEIAALQRRVDEAWEITP
jgi:pyruvate ferredoxin oxidoreductase beta subunit